MPTQDEVRWARRQARMTAKQAAALVGVKPVTWARWEGKTSRTTEMPSGLWELFMLKVNAIKGAK